MDLARPLHAVPAGDQGELFELPPLTTRSGGFNLTSTKNLPLNEDKLAEIIAAMRANPDLEIPVSGTWAGVLNKATIERGHLVVSCAVDDATLE